MSETFVPLSGYRAMWLMACFDLPVLTREQRRRATRFRKDLLRDGFTMLQLSVYARYCASEETADAHRRAIRSALPPEGEVRLLAITDRQFGKMEVYYGRSRRPGERKPEQLLLF